MSTITKPLPGDEVKKIKAIVDETNFSPEIKEHLKRTLVTYDDALKVLSQ